MNIAKIMIPKALTVFLNEKQTVRQGWEIMTRNGYTAIPVPDAEQHDIGTVSESDFRRIEPELRSHRGQQKHPLRNYNSPGCNCISC